MISKKIQVSTDIMVLFTSLIIIAVYAFTAFFFIDNTDRFRIGMAREEWRTEAEFIVNQLISSPNCFGYVKNIITYTNYSSGDFLLTVKSGVPNTIDASKLLADRFKSCLRLVTPEYRVFMEVEVSDETGIIFQAINIDKKKYFNPGTYEEIVMPVKIIFKDRVSYGKLKVGISVTQEYFNLRVS